MVLGTNQKKRLRDNLSHPVRGREGKGSWGSTHLSLENQEGETRELARLDGITLQRSNDGSQRGHRKKYAFKIVKREGNPRKVEDEGGQRLDLTSKKPGKKAGR